MSPACSFQATRHLTLFLLAAAAPVRATAARPTSRTASAVPDAALQALTAQMTEMKVSVEGLEKERDFYFNKVRPRCARRWRNGMKADRATRPAAGY